MPHSHGFAATVLAVLVSVSPHSSPASQAGLLATAAGPDRVGLAPGWARSARQSAPDSSETVKVVSQSPEEVTLEFRIGAPRGGESLHVSGRIAPLSALVRVPDTGAIDWEVVTFELADRDGRPAATPIGFDPGSLFEVSDPALMRDVRLVRVTFRADGGSWSSPDIVADAAQITIRGTGGHEPNERAGRHALDSPAFERLWASCVINYAQTREQQEPEQDTMLWAGSGAAGASTLEGSRYVIIAHDDLVPEIEPLLELKQAKGLCPRLVRVSEAGWTAEGIRAYLQSAYDNWDVRPEFVLLVGDESVPPGVTYGYTDNYFATLDGYDNLADVMVGRLPADDSQECANMIAKVVSYETVWLQDDPDWLKSGMLMVRDDEDDCDTIYYSDTWLVRDLMSEAGFTPVDTLFMKDGVTLDETYGALNEGRGLLNYRGVSGYQHWDGPFAVLPEELDNGQATPVVLSGTCYTGGFYGDGYLSERWLRAGTATEPRGGVAFFGTATACMGQECSLRRSWVCRGFFGNIFGDGASLGEACVAGKLSMYAQMNDDCEYDAWNLLGDPEMPVWTTVPSSLDVEVESLVSSGAASISLQVTSGGSAVENADVTCWSSRGIHGLARTDTEGQAVLSFEAAAPSTVEVSVLAKDAIPYRSAELLLTAGPFVWVDAVEVDDSTGGNGDGLISPGESALVSLRLRNVGDVAAESVEGRLRAPGEFAAVVDSIAEYQSLPSDAAAWGDAPFRVDMEDDWPGDRPVRLVLAVSCDGFARRWDVPPLQTVTGAMEVTALECRDSPPGGNGNGRLDAGEAAQLILTLDNRTPDTLESIECELSSGGPWVAVASGDAFFPDAAPASTSSNESDPLVVTVAPDAPPYQTAALRLRVSAAAPSYSYAETLTVNVEIAEVEASRPTGPDYYGYYAYDSTDTLFQGCPRFEWVDIAPPGPGTLVPIVTVADDGCRLLPPPFIIRYYGEPHYSTTLSSNGLMSLDQTTTFQAENEPIPSPYGPPSMVAPLWDDLDPSAGGDVYWWCDLEGHRFVLQFEDVPRKHTPDTETFQIIIYDSQYYPTPTGDAPILFQYESVAQVDSCTVGIEREDQNVGLQYVFDGNYAENAAPIRDGLAILFTTAAPETLQLPWLRIASVELDDTTGGNGDLEVCPGETVRVAVELENWGLGASDSMELRLCAGDSQVSVMDSTSALPSIPAGGFAGTGNDPFVISVNGAPPDSLVRLWLRLSGNAAIHQHALLYQLRIGARPQDGIEPAFALHTCRPNPFAGETTIAFDVSRHARAKVRVYDVAGRLVRTVYDGISDSGGDAVKWNGTDSLGHKVASGVYFVRLEADGKTASRKVVLLR